MSSEILLQYHRRKLACTEPAETGTHAVGMRLCSRHRARWRTEVIRDIHDGHLSFVIPARAQNSESKKWNAQTFAKDAYSDGTRRDVVGVLESSCVLVWQLAEMILCHLE